MDQDKGTDTSEGVEMKPMAAAENAGEGEGDGEETGAAAKTDSGVPLSPLTKDITTEPKSNIGDDEEPFLDLDSSMKSESEFASHLGALQSQDNVSSGVSTGVSSSLANSQRLTKPTSGSLSNQADIPTSGFDGAYDQPFWAEVSKKEDLEGLPPKLAFREARLDRIIKQLGSSEKALFFILRKCPLQGETRQLINGIVSRGVDVNTRENRTLSGPLHLAAERNFVHVARLLLDNEAPTQAGGVGGKLPVEIALEAKNDELAAVIMRNMSKASVRLLFEGQIAEDGSVTPPSLNFAEMVSSSAMPNTCKAILDSMLEATDEPDEYRFHYRALEADSAGHSPNMPTFSQTAKTAFHRILDGKNKDLPRHNVVRMLIHNKWSAYGEKMAWMNIGMYFLFMVLVSFSLVSAARQVDPRKYRGAENIIRGICEILSIICIMLNVVEEVREMKRERLAYLKQPYNYLQILSTLLLLLIIPLRWTGVTAQWHLASIAYTFLCLRMLQLISVLRIVGIYLQILTRILYKDVSRFTIIFILFLLTYTGALLLALRGERWEPEPEEGEASPTAGAGDTAQASEPGKTGTELDITRLTSSYPEILITGIRTMIQQESVVDYINEDSAHDSFGWLGIIINMLFLFIVLIVLLNILIAQLSDTYADVKADAQRELEQNWGVSLKNLEQSTSPFKRLRFQTYSHYQDVEHPGDTLIGWEEPADENEQEEEQRRQRQFDQHIHQQQQQIMALKAQMRTAIIMLQKNEEIPPQLRSALNELVRDTLPSMLGSVVDRSRDEVFTRMERNQSRQDKSFLLMHHSMGETSKSLQSYVGERHDEVGQVLRSLTTQLQSTDSTITAVSTQVEETLPETLQEMISVAHSSTVEELSELIKSTYQPKSQPTGGATASGERRSASSPPPGEQPHVVSQVQSIVANAQAATQDNIKLAHINTMRTVEQFVTVSWLAVRNCSECGGLGRTIIK
eukprot:scpid34405/ scgid2875/ 